MGSAARNRREGKGLSLLNASVSLGERSVQAQAKWSDARDSLSAQAFPEFSAKPIGGVSRRRLDPVPVKQLGATRATFESHSVQDRVGARYPLDLGGERKYLLGNEFESFRVIDNICVFRGISRRDKLILILTRGRW